MEEVVGESKNYKIVVRDYKGEMLYHIVHKLHEVVEIRTRTLIYALDMLSTLEIALKSFSGESLTADELLYLEIYG
jgi:hypothetical protein